ncbi:MAG: zinc-dependent alcohol dehydrogenase family protein, partial [Saprospiraceae bacterium]|nr:zinc-dependent alcohol dehydrogenase family protein [Saprospiraceae bacterium]
MKALLYNTFQGPLTIEKVPDPTPKTHGVVVKVSATGLCRSDWHGWMGHDQDIALPHVPGHELAGVVEAVGKDVRNFKVGDRVTVPFVCACGRCEQCDSGNHQVCDNQTQPGFTHWGSFAEYVALDHADVNLVRLPAEIDDVTAALLGCRFITSYRAIVHQGAVKSDQYVVVHGCGGVGLSAIIIAKALGAHVTAVDIKEESLKMARKLGADSIVNSTKSADVVSEVISLTRGGAHVSLDALGSQETSFNSISNLRKRGKHIQVGLMTGDHQHPRIPMDQVVANELEILGSHGMQAFKYPEVFDLIKTGKIDLKKFIKKTIS